MNITSLSLADNIYQDAVTGKYVLAGVYYQIDIPKVPFALPFNIRAYCAFERPKNPCELEFCIICESDKSIVALTESFELPTDALMDFLQLDMEFPIFNILRSGDYSIGVKVNGLIVKKSPFRIVLTDEQ